MDTLIRPVVEWVWFVAALLPTEWQSAGAWLILTWTAIAIICRLLPGLSIGFAGIGIEAVELLFTALLLPEAWCVRLARRLSGSAHPALFAWGNGLGMLCRWLHRTAARGKPAAEKFLKNKARLWQRSLLLLSLVPVFLVGFGIVPSAAPQAALYNGALAWWGSLRPRALLPRATVELDQLEMWTSPRPEATLVAKIPRGKFIRLYEHDWSGEWHLVSSPSYLGWVRSGTFRIVPFEDQGR